MKFQIVYFDDQAQNIELYKLLLKEDFNIAGFTETANFSEILKQHKPHGILLDLHMPTQDGLVLYDKIIQSENYNGCPVFFISGDISEDKRLKSLQLGAVDFFERTISEKELRLRLMNKIKMFLQGPVLIDIGNLQLNSESFNILLAGKQSDLTLIETRILIYLIKAIPEAVDKNDLMLKIWGPECTKGKINVHLSNMKAKLWNWDHEIKIKDNCLSIQAL